MNKLYQAAHKQTAAPIQILIMNVILRQCYRTLTLISQYSMAPTRMFIVMVERILTWRHYTTVVRSTANVEGKSRLEFSK